MSAFLESGRSDHLKLEKPRGSFRPDAVIQKADLAFSNRHSNSDFDESINDFSNEAFNYRVPNRESSFQ